MDKTKLIVDLISMNISFMHFHTVKNYVILYCKLQHQPTFTQHTATPFVSFLSLYQLLTIFYWVPFNILDIKTWIWLSTLPVVANELWQFDLFKKPLIPLLRNSS